MKNFQLPGADFLDLEFTPACPVDRSISVEGSMPTVMILLRTLSTGK
jgi:hypothetical protein